ncbi:reverse transcriptase domain-containing protein [Sphingopyxis yananensis]|uniref:reverse transcriptase domain-containing protein n=1 Tax=Sphingopyxis yananensis TaxID=2886687 RepID=UPI001D10D570|nr:reverse transcriptase domain-containing protein [Sphingopyxis yananensis]MCC2601533.1 reverse transcriptase/maturase family protein [Sphingopyxis yananensis]
MNNARHRAFEVSKLRSIWAKRRTNLVKSCSGIDRISGTQFEANLPHSLGEIRNRALSNYRPSGLLAIPVPKPSGGNRIICVPTISDRLIQFAVQHEILETVKKNGLLNAVSYGIVPNEDRTVQDARKMAIKMRTASGWAYKCDIVKFFDNVPREHLKGAIKRTVRLPSLYPVIAQIIDTEISSGIGPDWENIVASNGINRGIGIRQGMPLSPLLASILLKDLDCAIMKRGTKAIRYVDDIIAFFDTEKECRDFDSFISEELEKISLSIGLIGDKNSKTSICPPTKEIEFLGMELRPHKSSYELFIPSKLSDKIGKKIFNSTDIKSIKSNMTPLKEIINKLDNLKKGYISAYAGAQNMDRFVQHIEDQSTIALTNTVEQILGINTHELNKMQRVFLGITYPDRAQKKHTSHSRKKR